MPFAIFRRHQRKLLAVFAILAMFGFVLADTLPRLLNGSSAGNENPKVVDLYGKPIHRSDLARILTQRRNANLFMAELTGSPQFFGELNTKSLVDALILEHEADKLGMPAGPEFGREWLKQRVGARLNKDVFELLLSRFNNTITGEQLLTDLASQIRISNARLINGTPVVTPLDVFQAYRDQNERVSVKALPFRVEDFLSKAPEPTPDQLSSFFDKYKDALPVPESPTPGFKVPRQVTLEILSIDAEALAKSMQGKLTEAELQSYYENRKSEFKKPSEFPDQIFAGDDALEFTPPQVQAFAEVRPYLSTSLAEERALAELTEKFNRIKEDEMIPFADRYLDANDAIEDAKKAGEAVVQPLPTPTSLKRLAEKEGMEHEITPAMTKERAERYGLVSGSEVGMVRLSGGKKFAEEVFDDRSAILEPIELTDFNGRRYLVRKLKDSPPRVPSLDEVRSEVTLAWKTEQARPFAEKAAKEYAETLRKVDGKIVGEIVDGKPVITTDPVTKLQPGFPLPGRFLENTPATPTEIPQIPNAGPTLRNAFFGLSDGEVEVAPNASETTYYVLTVEKRLPASFATLYAPTGDFFRFRNEAMGDAIMKRDEQWMNQLRAEAGLEPGWEPPDEKSRG